MEYIVTMYMASFPEGKPQPSRLVAVPMDSVAEEVRLLREQVVKQGATQERMEKIIRALLKSRKRK